MQGDGRAASVGSRAAERADAVSADVRAAQSEHFVQAKREVQNDTDWLFNVRHRVGGKAVRRLVVPTHRLWALMLGIHETLAHRKVDGHVQRSLYPHNFEWPSESISPPPRRVAPMPACSPASWRCW